MRNLNHEYVIHLVAEFDNKDAAIFEFCGGGDLRNDYISSLVVHILNSKLQNSISFRKFQSTEVIWVSF